MRKNLAPVLSDPTSAPAGSAPREPAAAAPELQWPNGWRKALYYLSRITVHRPLRRGVVAILGMFIGRTAVAHENPHPQLATLREDGIVRLDRSLSASQCDEITAYLDDKPMQDRNGSAQYLLGEAKPGERLFGFHAVETVLDCPHLVEFAASPQIVRLAAEYLGCRPTLSSIGVQWSFPTDSPSAVQQFHRDSEDWKYLRFITYLTDVDDGSGPHVFIKGSHHDRLPMRLKSYTTEQVVAQHGAASVDRVLGPRGTAIAVDTCGIHKGELPTRHARLVLLFTYSILAQPFFRYEPIATRHAPALKHYSTRLFLR